MKTIFLQIAGYESAPVEIHITPDVTALNILTQAGLEECALFRTSEPQKYFQREDAVYDQLTDGEALYDYSQHQNNKLIYESFQEDGHARE